MGKVYWDEAEFKKANERLDVLALGDSWFWYPENNLLNSINRFSNEPNILCFGANGATSVELASGFYYASFISALKGYTAVAAVLISAGGNDFAGFDDFQKILKPDCSNAKKPSDCFDSVGLTNLINTVYQSYERLIHATLAIRPSAKIHLHNYDYAIPTGKGFLGLGQWLKAPMDARRVPDPDDLAPGSFRRTLIKILIDELGVMQDSLVRDFIASVIRVRTPGILSDNEWANELHATPSGFNKLGKQCFSPVLGPIVLGPAPQKHPEQIRFCCSKAHVKIG
ncbi:hypothetical protein QFZ94_008401 [Paraburkholderia sp. JPY465]|uniref:hypothetical protein n=1 Tax=Paraburkholderia sp. JPY465 TaxID=3042285 RepID=UPI003D228946